MPYNCDTWKTKKLENLVIPWQSFFKHERQDWWPDHYTDPENAETTLSICDSKICGIRDGDSFVVKSIDCSGEGSGAALNWIIEPALKDSKGHLIATRIWEGGDSIDRLIVKNGDVKTEAIEL